MVSRINNTSSTGLLGVGLIAAFIAAWISMLVFGAFAGDMGWYTPSYWETFFGLWSVAIVGSAFGLGRK
jgi:hypothetical protein